MELPDVYGSRVGIEHNILEAHQPRTIRAPARYNKTLFKQLNSLPGSFIKIYLS
jgi:hypothetical protein